MSGEKSKQNMFASSKGSFAATMASSDAIHSRRHIAQNFQLAWVDAGIDQIEKDYQSTLAQLQNIVNVNMFTQSDDCVNFLTEFEDIKTFLIVAGTIGEQIVPLIHDIPQLDTIYIFNENKFRHEQWMKKWAKIKGVHTEIMSIYESLRQTVNQWNQDAIAVSFIGPDEELSNQNLDQLEPSFMYTKIFKEIILEMEHTELSIKNFILFLRRYYINNTSKLNVIAEFQRDYCPQSSIWWYTRESFIYEMLNGALRTLEADTIINMGFFVCKLHHQIKQLHQNQINNYHEQPFVVYRGQGSSTTDFAKLLNTKDGLMSFNNFLSTSKDEEISRAFANSALGKTDTVGILFKMSIDPSISSIPFASIREVSYFQTEEEILFSMHTVFRIGEIKKIDNNTPLYQVDLKLTADDDQQLRTLTERMREETKGSTGWKRLGRVLIKIRQLHKAEELYKVLLDQTSDESDKALYYNQLGSIKFSQGDNKPAIWYYKKALEIRQEILPLNHSELDISYNNIASVYCTMGEHSKALSLFDKALEIRQKTLPPNHSSLATSYNNIALVHHKLGEYSKALSFYTKSLEISETTLPPNHPSLAASYNNIGLMYYNMEEYPKALSFYEKALEIRQKTLLPNHPDLSASYNGIASVYEKKGEHSKALPLYEKALEIQQKHFPPNHVDVAVTYNNIGDLYQNMGENEKALSFHEKALEIRQKRLAPSHPDLAVTYNNIGFVYENKGEYSKALSFYERAMEIFQSSLPSNLSNINAVQENIESVKKKL